MEGRVVRICIAPVKALHVVNPDEVELTHAGVAGDRRFWLVDRNRRLLNGKDHPELMRVQPRVGRGVAQARARVPGRSVVEGEVEPASRSRPSCTGTPHASRTVPGPWQEALSEFVGEPLTAALVGGRRTGPRKRPRRLGDARSLARVARAAAARRPALRSRSTVAASGCCSRSTASSRTRRTTWLGSRSARSGTQ